MLMLKSGWIDGMIALKSGWNFLLEKNTLFGTMPSLFRRREQTKGKKYHHNTVDSNNK